MGIAPTVGTSWPGIGRATTDPVVIRCASRLSRDWSMAGGPNHRSKDRRGARPLARASQDRFVRGTCSSRRSTTSSPPAFRLDRRAEGAVRRSRCPAGPPAPMRRSPAVPRPARRRDQRGRRDGPNHAFGVGRAIRGQRRGEAPAGGSPAVRTRSLAVRRVRRAGRRRVASTATSGHLVGTPRLWATAADANSLTGRWIATSHAHADGPPRSGSLPLPPSEHRALPLARRRGSATTNPRGVAGGHMFGHNCRRSWRGFVGAILAAKLWSFVMDERKM